MDKQEAERLIKGGEGQSVEFKKSFGERKEAIESLGAFANAKGGVVFFGVTDDGQVMNLSVGREKLRSFTNELRQKTQPPLAPGIERVCLGGRSVIAVSVSPVPKDLVVHVSDVPLIRVGETNQRMKPDEVKARYFSRFDPEKPAGKARRPPGLVNESWEQREKRRRRIYRRKKGLFLVHSWKASEEPDQVADIIISLRQHGDGPVTRGLVKSVEYHLGPKFSDSTIVRTDPTNGFRLDVSTYAPMLCLARVNFDDGSPPLDLERYIDF